MMLGLAGAATYFVSLSFLGSIRAGAKSLVAQLLEVLLIVLGPPWACLVSA